jgi:hypothetical protein
VYDTEKSAIDDLFVKLARAERDGGPRDEGAEGLIRRRLGEQPAAPYYMAQVILVQEQALEAAQQKINELERRAAQPAAGGFLAGLFGGGQPLRPRSAPQPGWGQGNPGGQGYGRQGYGGQGVGGQGFGGQGAPRGGGFMAGAMQTAMGVAGGLVVGNLLMDAFSSDIGQVATDVTQGATDAASDLAADAGFDMGDEIL